MEVASARARLVDFAADDSSSALATIPRSEIEQALHTEGAPPELILDITRYAGEDKQTAETGKVSVFWGKEDLEELLRRAEGKSVTLVFDPHELMQAYEADVEAHGLREVAAVIAVAVAAGTGAGYAHAQPAEGTSVGGATTIEQVRSDAAGAPVGAGIEAVRSAAAATTPVGADIEAVRLASAETIAASAPAPVGSEIEAVRIANAQTIADSAAPAVGDIEAVRTASAQTIADSAAPAVGDIEAVRSAATTSALTAVESVEAARSSEIAASVASGQSAVDIEAVRTAAAEATRASADTGGGINVSLPSPAVTGALGGAVALLITGAAFAARRQRPIGPA